MSQEVALRAQAIDRDDKVASASIAASTTTKLTFSDGTTNFRTRTGRKGRLTFVGNDVDAGGETYLTFSILVNGARISDPLLSSFQQAIGETFDPSSSLSVPLELPQNALIEVSVTNSNGSTAYNAFIRLRVEYEPLN